MGYSEFRRIVAFGSLCAIGTLSPAPALADAGQRK
jgi:hypothetical protein